MLHSKAASAGWQQLPRRPSPPRTSQRPDLTECVRSLEGPRRDTPRQHPRKLSLPEEDWWLWSDSFRDANAKSLVSLWSRQL